MELKTVLIVGATVLVGISFIPFTLPGQVHVERSAIINAQPHDIFPMLASGREYQRFNPYKTADPDLRIELNDVENGIGSGFAFDGKDGKGTQVVTALTENRSVTMQIDLGSMGQPVQQFELEPTNEGTKVTWSMDMSFGMNPIGRVFGLFMDGMVGKTYEQGLVNMAKAVTPST